MSEIKKAKNKKFYKNKPNKRLNVDVNQRGFLCSCNNRTKDCIKESYNLLNLYADKLLGKTEETKPEEDDIAALLSQEISNLKQETKRFQVVDSGAKHFLFIKTTLENPVELVEKIVNDIYTTKTQQTKFLLRLIPVEITCKAYTEDILKAFEPLCSKYFKEGPKTFSIIFNHRNNNSVSKDEVIKVIADKIAQMGPEHKVNLKGAEISVIIEVIKGFAFIGIVHDYFKYKKYNLLAITEAKVVQEENL